MQVIILSKSNETIYLGEDAHKQYSQFVFNVASKTVASDINIMDVSEETIVIQDDESLKISIFVKDEECSLNIKKGDWSLNEKELIR